MRVTIFFTLLLAASMLSSQIQADKLAIDPFRPGSRVDIYAPLTSPIPTECATRVSCHKDSFSRDLREILARLACSRPIPITNLLINQPGGFVINTPGYYCVVEELVWNPTADGQVAIRVNSSDVVIDGKNLTLQQNTASTTSTNVGIRVEPNFQNILILDLTIQNFSTLGLYVLEGVHQLTLDRVNLIKNGGRGTINPYPFTATTGVALLDLSENGTQYDFAGGGIIRGLPDNPVRNVTVSKCNFNENTSTWVGGGIIFGFIEDSFIYDSNFCHNIGNIYVAGAWFPRPKTVSFYNNHSSFNSTTFPTFSGSNRSEGIAIWGALNMWIDRCLFEGNNAIFEASGIDQDPLSLNGTTGTYLTSSGFVVTNCVADGLFVRADDGVTGFTVGFNVKQCDLIKNCIVSNCYNTGALDLGNIIRGNFGYILRDPFGGTVEDCIAVNIGEPVIDGEQIISNATAGGYLIISLGGQISNDLVRKPNVFINCRAINCRSTNGAYGVGFGNIFPDFSFVLPGTIFDNCIAEDCQSDVTNQGIGFNILYSPQTIMRDCISRGNDIGYLVDSFSGQPGSTYNSVSNESVFYRNLASNNDIAGFIDKTGNFNVYKNNESDNNGPTGATNYVGMPIGTPIALWNLAAGQFPQPSGAPNANWDNLDVIQTP